MLVVREEEAFKPVLPVVRDALWVELLVVLSAAMDLVRDRGFVRELTTL